MKEEEIIRKLKQEAERDVPDVSEKVVAAARDQNSAPAGEVLVRSKKRGLLWAAGLVVLVAILVTLAFTLWRGGGAGAAPFKLVVSINPSVEFTLDDGKVSSTRSLNRDAAVLLKDENFTGDTAEEAVLRFAELADGSHLIGADGIRLHVEGQDDGTLQRVRSSLSARYAQYSVTDMNEADFDALVATYNESEMGDFEDWLAREFDGQKAQFKTQIDALLQTYEEDLAALDTSDPAQVAAFNQKYLSLGEDLTFEDGDERKAELLGEFAELKVKLERSPERMTDELFREFLDEIEDVYEHRFDPDNDDDDDEDDDDDDDDEDDD